MGGQTREEILAKYQTGGARSPNSREAIVNKYASGGGGNIQPLEGSIPYEPTAQDRINAFGGGASMGFADEIRAGMGAGLDYVTGQDSEFGKNYEGLLNTYQDEEDRYAKAAPVENLALNLAGGISSAAVTAAKAIPAATTGLPKFLAHLGVATGEGAIAGAGAAKQDERLEGAKEGALFGGGMKLGLDAVGKVFKPLVGSISERRTAQDLGSGDDFIPLHVADPESSLAKAYENSVGRMWFSNIPEQTERVARRMQPHIDDAIVESTNASKAATVANTQLQDRLGQNRANVARTISEEAEDAARKASTAARTQATDTKSAIEAGTDFGVKGAEQKFRQLAINSGTPPGASKEVLEKLQGASPQQASRTLSQVWKNGFQDVKSKTFDVNPQEVIDDALGDINVPGLDDYSKGILDQLQTKLTGKTALPKSKKLNPLIHGSTKAKAPSPIGKIAGADLMEARNSFRVAINEMKDKGASAQQREAFRRVAKKLDEVIEGGLSDAEKIAYKAERDAWGNYQTMRGASGRAAANKQGDFSPADWITEKKLAQKRRVDEGTAPLQQEAQATQKAIDEAKRRAKGKIADAGDIKDNTVDAAGATRRNTERKLKRATKKAEDAARLRDKTKLSPDKMSLKGAAAEEAQRAIGKAGVEPGNIFTQRAAQSMLPIVGGMAAGPVGAAGLPAAAYAASKGLSSQGFQRALAGQTSTQELIADILRRIEDPKNAEAFNMLGTGLRRGTITGNGEI